MIPTVTVTLPEPPADDLADGLAGDLGVYPHVEAGSIRGVDPTTVTVVIATAVGVFLTGMLERFGAATAERLMSAVDRLRRGLSTPDTEVVLLDEANHVRVVLDRAALEDDRALHALLALERDAYRPDVQLRWNARFGRWQAHRQ